MLAFLAFKSLKTECNNINDLKSCFKDIDVLKNAILKMSSLDYLYLQHTDFVYRISFISNADFIEKDLLRQYDYLLEDKSWNNILAILMEVDPLWSNLFDSIRNNMACFELTAQGFYLGLIRLSKVVNQQFDYDNFLNQLW